MKTIIILKICNELPDMYIIIAFIGRALAGAKAISQDFLILSWSVSATVGGLRAGALKELADRCTLIQYTDRRAFLVWAYFAGASFCITGGI